MPDQFTVTIEDDKLLVELDEFGRNVKMRVVGVLAGGAHYAAHWLRVYVHVQSGYTIRHIDADTSPRWHPGGRTGGIPGGGEWEAVAGIRRGLSQHPLYANFGTGIYVNNGVITAEGVPRFTIEEAEQAFLGKNRPGGYFGGHKLMNLQKRGEKRKAIPYQKGQQAQNFLYAAMRQTQVYLGARIMTLGRDFAVR